MSRSLLALALVAFGCDPPSQPSPTPPETTEAAAVASAIPSITPTVTIDAPRLVTMKTGRTL